MTRVAIVLSLFALVLALPAAASAAPATDSTAPAVQSADLAAAPATLILPATTGPLGGVPQAETCAQEDFFVVFLPGFCVTGECEQACQDGGGTFLFSFFDRIYCNCFCCAE